MQNLLVFSGLFDCINKPKTNEIQIADTGRTDFTGR